MVVHPSQRACHGQTTSKQRYIDACNVYTTLFQRSLTMMCPLGYIIFVRRMFLIISQIQKKIIFVRTTYHDRFYFRLESTNKLLKSTTDKLHNIDNRLLQSGHIQNLSTNDLKLGKASSLTNIYLQTTGNR